MRVHPVIFLVVLSFIHGDLARATLDEQPIRHPLKSPSALSIRASRLTEAPEVLLRDLVAISEVNCPEQGDCVVGQRAALRELERDPVPSAVSTVPNEGLWTAPEVDDWLSSPLTAPAEVEVVFGLDRRQWRASTVSVTYQQELAIFSGAATTRADLGQVRRDVVAQWRENGMIAMAPTLEGLARRGAQVLSSSPLTGSIRARVSGSQLEEILLAHPEIVQVDVPPTFAEDAGYSMVVEGSLDGIEVADLLQAKFFYERGYFGHIDEWIGVTEISADQIYNWHPSFLTSTLDPRVLICGGTDPAVCDFLDAFSGASHPTRVTSIIASDLMEGQDPNVTDTTARKQRTGIARKVPILAMDSDPTDRVVEIMSDTEELWLLNQSQTVSDANCDGVNDVCDDWNALYEAGVALFNSIHSSPGAHADPDLCTARAPATALGVMASGSYLVTDPPNSIETLDPQTARGGGGATLFPSDGNGRTIVGLLTPSGFVYRAEHDENTVPAYEETGNFGQTSASSPSLTAAAALFREWFQDEVGDDIDAPGLLYANLLLMGDRIDQTNGRMSSGFDNVGGAGILRLRMFNADGIDNPGAWATGSVCVDDSTTVTIGFNGGNTLPAAVDYIKVVAWWYDYRHDLSTDGNDFNEVHLKLQKDVSGTWTDVQVSDDHDNRQRVYSGTSVGGSAWRFRLRGEDVNTLNTDYGCGVDSVKVYWASLWEDNARDDGGDLTNLVRPEP
jgi:hypothetical protein